MQEFSHPSLQVDCGMGCYNIKGYFTILDLAVNNDAGYTQLSDFTVLFSESCTDLPYGNGATLGCVHFSSDNP